MSKFRRRLIAAGEKPLYTELEYIKTYGHQYIDTGLKAGSDTKVITKVKLLSYFDRASNFIFGGWEPEDNHYLASFSSGGSPSLFDARMGSVDIQSNAVNYLGQDVLINMSKEAIYVNGTNLGPFSSTNYTTYYNLFIFSYAGADSRVTNMLMYSFKLYKNNILVQDLIPCKDKQGIVCMYDLVSETFFYNQGTGSFEAGPEI